MSKSREQLVKYLSEIDITDKVVLDAGCGPKDKWARNFTKGEPKEYITWDIDKKHNPDKIFDLNIMLMGSLTIGCDFDDEIIRKKKMKEREKKQEEKRVDIIFCIETLEHLYRPATALDTFYENLKQGGKLYLSTPFINPYHDEVDYARYTSEWYEKVLTEVGFKDIKIKPRLATEGLPHLLQFYKLEGLRMSKTRLQKGQQNKMAEIGYFIECQK